ncbi:MAG: rhomboid family intramembrane serine protease [Erysipelotrichaceae bacterium]|nr:rhomboid family intramembrane serine protease [Erysipelotrichaceae bacterium]
MAKKDQYKIYQLTNVFISRYGFSQIVLDRYQQHAAEEAWLIHPDDEHFNLIRVSLAAPLIDRNEEDRIDDYIRAIQERTGKEIRFLDIHITKDPYSSDREYHHMELEEAFSSGEDVHEFYPEIYTAIHQVENEESEIFALASQMRKTIMERRKQLLKQRRPVYNYAVMAICVILYFITFLLSRNYSFNTVLIFLGANYHTFTLGLKQYYRLILCGFLHGSFLHLFTNMYSMYFVGSYVERKYGGKKYLAMLLSSVLTGSLSQAIMSDNTILVGVSAALYAFMLVFIIDSLKANRMNFMSVIPLILINLGINFISTTAWLAHLGGLIAGYLVYLIYENPENKGPFVLLVLMIALLFMKYLSIRSIHPFYGGNDMEIIKMLKDFGFDSYADKLWNRLIEVYQRYGG